MLTVKVRESRNCAETVFEARQVRKFHYEQPKGGPLPATATLPSSLHVGHDGAFDEAFETLRRKERVQAEALSAFYVGWEHMVASEPFRAWMQRQDAATKEAVNVNELAPVISDAARAADVFARFIEEDRGLRAGSQKVPADHLRKKIEELESRYFGRTALTFIGEVRCDAPGGEIVYHIRAGTPVDGSDDQTMYVMNENGATIATYHL